MITDFAEVIDAFKDRPDVAPARMFGSEGLKVGGKVFAMSVRGSLVVKLAKARAEALAATGAATPFDPGHGRPMKQWIAVAPDAALDWLALAEEAMACVAAEASR
jgi:TfoX/Sxy family transcriptional regulator of competence genes